MTFLLNGDGEESEINDEERPSRRNQKATALLGSSRYLKDVDSRSRQVFNKAIEAKIGYVH